MGKYYVYTVEHRVYLVKAKSSKEAEEIIRESDLEPKDDRVKLESFGDFIIDSVKKY